MLLFGSTANHFWSYSLRRRGEQILDLGCGTGQLTEKIAQSGAFVQGIDSSLSMISTAKVNYPHINFSAADARSFQVEEPLDAVFSNAVLHWIKQPDAVINCVEKALKPGGRFVAEFGGKGNVGAIVRRTFECFVRNWLARSLKRLILGIFRVLASMLGFWKSRDLMWVMRFCSIARLP